MGGVVRVGDIDEIYLPREERQSKNLGHNLFFCINLISSALVETVDANKLIAMAYTCARGINKLTGNMLTQPKTNSPNMNVQ